jgi:hypothetical protein
MRASASSGERILPGILLTLAVRFWRFAFRVRAFDLRDDFFGMAHSFCTA